MPAPMALETNEDRQPRKKRLMRRVLQSDPGQEYLVYEPSSKGPDAPLLVSIHGASRNADEHARLLSAYCEMHGAVLVAPLFSAERHPDYQRLGRVGRGGRADASLNMIVAEAAALTGASGERFYLFGFSGGAQFAHRYAMAHPHRVAGAVFASGGWYTLPDPARRYPFGVRPSNKLPGVRLDAEEFLRVPMTVVVGADDKREAGLRHTPRLDQDQGVNRIERARCWATAMKASADAHRMESMVNYLEIENCDSSFKRSILRSELGDKVFEAFFGAPTASASAASG
jgi:pimeloyl-ACP methyl ester carboxylesterase